MCTTVTQETKGGVFRRCRSQLRLRLAGVGGQRRKCIRRLHPGKVPNTDHHTRLNRPTLMHHLPKQVGHRPDQVPGVHPVVQIDGCLEQPADWGDLRKRREKTPFAISGGLLEIERNPEQNAG